eukprot:scaffold182031_cov33-Tisochrysis_lutea.AAC.3
MGRSPARPSGFGLQFRDVDSQLAREVHPLLDLLALDDIKVRGSVDDQILTCARNAVLLVPSDARAFAPPGDTAGGVVVSSSDERAPEEAAKAGTTQYLREVSATGSASPFEYRTGSSRRAW